MARQSIRKTESEAQPPVTGSGSVRPSRSARMRRRNGALGALLAVVVATVFAVAVAVGIVIHYMEAHHVLGPL